MKKYTNRAWLNSAKSPSTGSVVAYHGNAKYGLKKKIVAFLEISDCHSKVRLHQSNTDSIKDFIKKLKKLSKVAKKFAKHLKMGEK